MYKYIHAVRVTIQLHKMSEVLRIFCDETQDGAIVVCKAVELFL